MEVPEELQELIENASAWSNESWVNINEDCYGIEIINMNLRHLMMLDGVESPFLKGGDIKDEDVALFLWIVSKEFCFDEKKQKEFFKKVVKIRNIDAIRWINNYLKKTFIDSDTMNKGKKGQVYFISYFVDMFAKEYNWSFEEIMKMPLRISFQLITAMNERNAKSNGTTYNRVTELDNTINRWILNSKSSNGI
jgi:hypothetical protein